MLFQQEGKEQDEGQTEKKKKIEKTEEIEGQVLKKRGLLCLI